MHNQNQMPNESINDVNHSEEFDIYQIFDFFIGSWKKIAAGSVFGAIFGIAGWFLFVPYKAESILVNNDNYYSSADTIHNKNSSDGNLSFITWRGLEKNLPILASQIFEKSSIPDRDAALLKKLSVSLWWQKNIRPTYVLTKADAKNMAVISKALQESGGNEILNLMVNVTGSSKQMAEENVEFITSFIKQGSAYLSIKGLVKGIESNALNSDTELRKRILNADVELKFLQDRAKKLENLRQQFPESTVNNSQQVLDMRDANSKFMPIRTQLVAVNNDINTIDESLQRMRDQLVKTKILKIFADRAKPITSQYSNGLKQVEELLEILAKMRSEFILDNTNASQAINDIESSLINIHTFYGKSLEVDLRPRITKSSPLLSVLGGVFGGAALVLFSLAGLNVLRKIKCRLINAPKTYQS
jgi:hypothetical protein